jgi:hypothetical protein
LYPHPPVRPTASRITDGEIRHAAQRAGLRLTTDLPHNHVPHRRYGRKEQREPVEARICKRRRTDRQTADVGQHVVSGTEPEEPGDPATDPAVDLNDPRSFRGELELGMYRADADAQGADRVCGGVEQQPLLGSREGGRHDVSGLPEGRGERKLVRHGEVVYLALEHQ